MYRLTYKHEKGGGLMEKNQYSMRKGFKNARKRKGMTQSEVASEMDVNIKTVMNWEQGVSNPDFKTAMRLSELFQCDLDCLTGKIEERTHDIHFIQCFTGLSGEAIEKISNPDLGNPAGKTLSRMIETERFNNLISTYKIFLTFVSRITADDADDSSPWLELNKENVVLGTQQAARHFKQEVLSAMESVCDDDLYGRINNVRREAMISKLKHNQDEILNEFSERKLDRKEISREIKNIEKELKLLSEEKTTLEEILQIIGKE